MESGVVPELPVCLTQLYQETASRYLKPGEQTAQSCVVLRHQEREVRRKIEESQE